jgi:hypothetical protein
VPDHGVRLDDSCLDSKLSRVDRGLFCSTGILLVDKSEICATSRKPERERAADTATATSYHSPPSHQVRMHNAPPSSDIERLVSGYDSVANP